MLSKMIQMNTMNTIIAIFNVVMNITITMIIALPAAVCWNKIAPIYLREYIPVVFLNVNYWHVVAFFIVCTYLGEQIQKLTPKIITISKEN